MPGEKDVCVEGLGLYFLPLKFRTPLKFGRESLESCECVRAKIVVSSFSGKSVIGWGETPFGVTWAWPSLLSIESRLIVLRAFCRDLAEAWLSFESVGHALEIGHAFNRDVLPKVWASLNTRRREAGAEQLPWLAALLCATPFDLALHDAYGKAQGLPSFSTYGPGFLNRDLAWFFDEGSGSAFSGRYPEDFFQNPAADSLEAWHLVGAADPLECPDESEGGDGEYPVSLRGWIRRDGLTALKVKLLGVDEDDDIARLAAIGVVALEEGVGRLGVDFNCTVTDPDYVTRILDKLASKYPTIASTLLYVEQPFPPDLEAAGMDVTELGSRLVLLMDESASDWRSVDRGRRFGWSGVALKTCKTFTGAILSLCRARATGMAIMVQDLTNPMLALIPHALFASHAGSIAGIEVNAAQFCPEASLQEEAIHPGLYRRRGGRISVESLAGVGLGYGGAETARSLPPPAFEAGAA